MPQYSYAGKILDVNLTDGSVLIKEVAENVVEDYIGGAGFGAKYLYEENPLQAKWSDPENRLIFANGPLGNTAVRGSGTICVVTKGPMTNLAVSTQANGFMGSSLKSCGYDGLVIHGQAKQWCYLHIAEDTIEIRDAYHLVGKDTQQTQEKLKKELGLIRGVSVYCIGPAGENKVRFSVIMGDQTHTASKNGVGAVMGAKNLKAIVVCRGRKKQEIYDKPGLVEVAKELHEKATTFLDGSRHKWGTNGAFSRLHDIGALPVKNYTTNIFPEHQRMNGPYVRGHFKPIKRRTCFNCGLNHIYVREVTEGPYKGFIAEEPEYEAFAAFGPIIGQTDAGTVFFLTDLTDRLGLDVNEIGWVLGWVMECYEKGFFSLADTDGLEMTWGNVEAVIQLIKKIAKREGFGDMLAHGVKRASETVGGEASNLAVFTKKGSTPRGHDHRARWYELLDTCMTNTSTLEATFLGARPHLMNMPPAQAAFSPWEVPLVNAFQNGLTVIEDCLGVCRFNLNYPEIALQAYNAATGMNRGLEEMMKAGKRIINTLRLFNLNNGLRPEIEAPSPRYGSAPVDGPARGISILENWDHIREIYYRSMGWDPKTGVPTRETLKDLGLS